jgi:thiamine pyrophosphate-dependent acetolactate synthase large subunit-like protein
MLDAETACINEGIRLIDTRHEQGAAYMAQAYSRVTQGPGVCMAASGPATLNLGTGLANALIDCCPVVALGGSSPIGQFGRQVFQEIDQVKALEGCVKYADRVHNLKRLPQQINFAFQKALNGKPGPAYLVFRATCSTRASTRRMSTGATWAARSLRRVRMPNRRR